MRWINPVNCLMFTIQYQKNYTGVLFAMATLPPPLTKHITLSWQRGFSGGGKKNSTLSHVLNGEVWVTGRSGLRLWLWLRISSQECYWFCKKKNSSAFGTIHFLNQDNLVPNCRISYYYCMQDDQACNKPVVQNSLYPMINLTTRTTANIGWILIPKPLGTVNGVTGDTLCVTWRLSKS